MSNSASNTFSAPLLLGIAVAAGVGALVMIGGGSADADKSEAASETAVERPVATMEREEIEQIIYDYLMENPEVILDAVDKYQQDKLAAADEAAVAVLEENWEALVDGPYTFSVGPADAKVTVIEFFDYNCGYCRVATPHLLNAIDDMPDVRFVFKEYPIRGADSVAVAKASLAAIGQDKYLELHQGLMTAEGRMSLEKFEEIAAGLGMDVEKIRSKMDDQDVQAALEQNAALTEALYIEGTPSFVIGKSVVRGWPGPEKFKQMVEDAKNG